MPRPHPDQTGVPKGFKRCVVCRETRPLVEYYTYLRNAGGLTHFCKDCGRKRSVLYTTEARAKKKGVPFTLTAADLSFPETCPICDEVLVRGEKKGESSAPSVDRIIPSLGYVPENIIIICMRCNIRKSTSSPEDMIRIAEFFLRLRKDRGLC